MDFLMIDDVYQKKLSTKYFAKLHLSGFEMFMFSTSVPCFVLIFSHKRSNYLKSMALSRVLILMLNEKRSATQNLQDTSSAHKKHVIVKSKTFCRIWLICAVESKSVHIVHVWFNLQPHMFHTSHCDHTKYVLHLHHFFRSVIFWEFCDYKS